MFRATVTEMDNFLKSLGYLKGKPTIDFFMSSIKMNTLFAVKLCVSQRLSSS